MANKTVYPFGTNGTLPGSIAIVNDLKTGGANKALSAEQGKIIGDELFSGLFDATADYTLVTGQSYGSVGSTISTDSNNKYQYIRLENVDNLIVRVKTPDSGTPSSLIQYVDSTNKITRRYVESYPVSTSVLVSLKLETGESAVYVCSANGTMEIYDLSRSKYGVADERISIDLPNYPSQEAWVNDSTGLWATTYGNIGSFVKVTGAKYVIIYGKAIGYKSKYALLKSRSFVAGSSPDYVTGESNRHDIDLSTIVKVEIPSDCNYIWIAQGSYLDSSHYRPEVLAVVYPQGYASLKRIVTPTNARKYSSVDKNGDSCFEHRPRWWNGDYFRGGVQTAIPVGADAIGYNDFISNYWDTFLTDYPDNVTKETILKDNSDTYNIYKYVFTPAFYTKTIVLSAGMHGNEYEGFWGLYRLMRLIYGDGSTNPVLRSLFHDVRFVVVPVLNPYGMQHKQRYNSLGYDQNYNYGVDWDTLTHTGTSAFQSAEPLAVKKLCDEYGNDISLYIDFHTDPYNATKANYLETDEDSVTYKYCYDLTIDERIHIEDKFDYHSIDTSFVVWENTAATSFRYMEWIRKIPSVIAEVAVNGYAVSGSAEQMEGAVDFYMNVILTMVANCT